jgi:predicted PurR-regulated permease PerM
MPTASSPLNQERYRRFCIAFLAVGISILFFMVIWDFLMPLLLGGIFAGLLQPVYKRFLGWFGGRKPAASIVTLLLTIILIGLPLLILGGVVAEQAVRVSQASFAWMELHLTQAEINTGEAKLIEHFPQLEGLLPQKERMVEAAGKLASELASFLVRNLAIVTSGAASFLLNAFVMLYGMYFFLMNGPAFLEKLLHFAPLTRANKVDILGRFTEVSRATIKGSMVIGFIQGLLGGIGFHFAGIEGAAFWGTIMMVLSIIPGIGTPLVWLPAVVMLFVKGETGPAVMLLVWSVAVVSSIDNVLRPRLVGKDAGLPDLLILVGTLGGIFLFGAVGFIVGPVICALFITIWEIYHKAYQVEPQEDDEPATQV